MKQMRTFVLLIAFVIAGAGVFARAAQNSSQKPQVYAKDQAARGAAQYANVCAACHDPAKTPPAGKDKGPELIGEKFTDEWQDRTLGELLFTIRTTMPNDGSVVLSESETADLAAYILQANGYPDGPTALKYDAAADTPIVK